MVTSVKHHILIILSSLVVNKEIGGKFKWLPCHLINESKPISLLFLVIYERNIYLNAFIVLFDSSHNRTKNLASCWKCFFFLTRHFFHSLFTSVIYIYHCIYLFNLIFNILFLLLIYIYSLEQFEHILEECLKCKIRLLFSSWMETIKILVCREKIQVSLYCEYATHISRIY